MASKGLYANINARKKAGTSRSKSESTISSKSYKNMQEGFPKKKAGGYVLSDDNKRRPFGYCLLVVKMKIWFSIGYFRIYKL